MSLPASREQECRVHSRVRPKYKHPSWQAPGRGGAHMGGTCPPSGAPGTGAILFRTEAQMPLAVRRAAWKRCLGESQDLTPLACCDREVQRLGKPVSHSQ